ncbi:hypothetical protein CSPAE12_01484 [Colletotrichum incanum]|nr:hypothetical protein CSPAE12_01484 [Colletotrichum incanum]
MIAHSDPDLNAQIINPPTLYVTRSVEKKKRPHPGTWYLKINNANGAIPNHACACTCMWCVWCRPCRPYPKGLPGDRYQNSV